MKTNHEIQSYLSAMLQQEAYIKTIKPIIQSIYNEVLDYMIPPKYRICKRTNETITHYDDLYRIDERDDPKVAGYLTRYYAEVDKVLTEKGYPGTKPRLCHLLESESLLRDTTRKFVFACIKILPDKLLDPNTPEQFYDRLTYKHYKKFVEINKAYHIQFLKKGTTK